MERDVQRQVGPAYLLELKFGSEVRELGDEYRGMGGNLSLTRKSDRRVSRRPRDRLRVAYAGRTSRGLQMQSW
jgi:hypothetical protein